MHSCFHQSRGFALIEVMISLVIIAIALVSHSQMMGKSMKYSTQTAMVTQADILANDILEKIANNRESLAVYRTGDIDDADPDCIKINNNCTAAERALAEKKEWQDKITSMFPTEFGSPSQKALPTIDLYDNTAVIVSIFWNQDGKTSRVKRDCTGSKGDTDSEQMFCHRVKSGFLSL